MSYKTYTLDNKFIALDEFPANFTGIVERSDTTRYWYVNGSKHRLDGPAVEYVGGSKHWYVNDNLHRIDGPACENSNGTKLWYIDGEEVTELQCKLLYGMMKLKGLL